MPSRILSAIKNAAAKTGVDFSYLVQKASQESGGDASAKASTSSATGLFQFTSQTWLQMVKNNGAQYGLGAQAAQITTDSSGHLSVSDPAVKQQILALRNDPTLSAEMAGELDKQNAASLQQSVGGKIGGTELYLAHFLGAGGASDFLSRMRSNPGASGASVLPDAAAANSSVFYDKSGQPRSLSQIYQHFAAKFGGGSDAPATTQVASVTPAQTVAASSAVTPQAASAAIAAISAPPSSTQVASLYSSTSPLSATVASAGIHSVAAYAAATTSTTLFTTMMLGQMNGTGAQQDAALASLEQSEGRKRNALSVLSAAA